MTAFTFMIGKIFITLTKFTKYDKKNSFISLHSQHFAQLRGAVMRLWITVMKQNGHGHMTVNWYQH